MLFLRIELRKSDILVSFDMLIFIENCGVVASFYSQWQEFYDSRYSKG